MDLFGDALQTPISHQQTLDKKSLLHKGQTSVAPIQYDGNNINLSIWAGPMVFLLE